MIEVNVVLLLVVNDTPYKKTYACEKNKTIAMMHSKSTSPESGPIYFIEIHYLSHRIIKGDNNIIKRRYYPVIGGK